MMFNVTSMAMAEMFFWVTPLLICVFVFILLWRFHRRNQVIEQQLKTLERELKISHNSAIGMGQKIITLEKKLRHDKVPVQNQLGKTETARISQQESLVETEDEKNQKHTGAELLDKNNSSEENDGLSLRAQEKARFEDQEISAQESVYDEARSYLSRGRSVNEVAKKCGLSQSEVSLLRALSKQVSPAS